MNERRKFATVKPLLSITKSRGKVAKVSKDWMEESVQSLAERMEHCRDEATYQFQIMDGKKADNYCFRKRGGQVSVEKTYANEHDFGFQTTQAVWQQMVSGQLSPIDAFLEGKLLISGDEKEGFRLFFRLADDNGAKTIF